MNLKRITFVMLYRIILKFFLSLIMACIFYKIISESVYNLLFEFLLMPIVLTVLLYWFPVRTFSCKDKKQIGILLAISHFIASTCIAGFAQNIDFIFILIGTLVYSKGFTWLDSKWESYFPSKVVQNSA